MARIAASLLVLVLMTPSAAALCDALCAAGRHQPTAVPSCHDEPAPAGALSLVDRASPCHDDERVEVLGTLKETQDAGGQHDVPSIDLPRPFSTPLPSPASDAGPGPPGPARFDAPLRI